MIIFDRDTFKYPSLNREHSEQYGRRYVTPDGQKLASVTTILEKTKSEESKQALENWRNRVGHKNAQEITTGAANLGSLLHSKLEQYILGEELTWGNNMIQIIAKKMVNTVIEQGLPKIQKIYGLEAALYYSSLYAGTADLIIQADNQIMIADFKNSLKIKKEEWVEGYYCQMVAYALAHNEMFGTDINAGRIMMVARPDDRGVCEYKEFDLDPKKFLLYKDKWIQSLDKFYNMCE